MPEFFGPLSRSAFLVNKKGLFLQKCIELLTVFQVVNISPSPPNIFANLFFVSLPFSKPIHWRYVVVSGSMCNGVRYIMGDFCTCSLCLNQLITPVWKHFPHLETSGNLHFTMATITLRQEGGSHNFQERQITVENKSVMVGRSSESKKESKFR